MGGAHLHKYKLIYWLLLRIYYRKIAAGKKNMYYSILVDEATDFVMKE